MRGYRGNTTLGPELPEYQQFSAEKWETSQYDQRGLRCPSLTGDAKYNDFQYDDKLYWTMPINQINN